MLRTFLKNRAALLLLGVAACIAGCVPAGSPQRMPAPVPPAAPMPSQVSVATPRALPGKRRDQPPADLLNAVQALGSGFPGQVGIAVRDVTEGWIVGYNADRLLPQQSVSKLWVAIAVMDAVDRGTLTLSDIVTVRRSDLTVFHQPIRPLVGIDGYRTTIAALLQGAMTRSDNTCNDVLLWKIGGPPAIRRMLMQKGIAGVGFGPGERLLQAKTAGLDWKPEWAGGWGFLQARSKMSVEARSRALNRYLAAPYDGASANGVTLGLARLQRGEVLSSSSTLHLLTLMAASKTGPLRLKSGLRSGWTFAHKTGTGQDLGTLSTGYNDVGLLKAPDGHTYAVAVMIGSTRRPIAARMQFMGNVTRAIIRTLE